MEYRNFGVVTKELAKTRKIMEDLSGQDLHANQMEVDALRKHMDEILIERI
jgi:hypothetical protein